MAAGLAGPHVEEPGYAEAEEGECEQGVRPEPETRVHGPADHAEAVDRGQGDSERREPRVQVARRREHGLAGDEIRHEEEADLEGVAAEDVGHRERVVAEPHGRNPG